MIERFLLQQLQTCTFLLFPVLYAFSFFILLTLHFLLHSPSRYFYPLHSLHVLAASRLPGVTSNFTRGSMMIFFYLSSSSSCFTSPSVTLASCISMCVLSSKNQLLHVFICSRGGGVELGFEFRAFHLLDRCSST